MPHHSGDSRPKVLVTGGGGFIGGYLIQDLLEQGFEVVSLDNYSKYGKVVRSFASSPYYQEVVGDAKDTSLLLDLLKDCDHLIACAAMIGGISYFHEFAYDLIAENERIAASTFDAAIVAFQKCRLQKITLLSSSMVYESVSSYPTLEGQQLTSPPPLSTYGFQKLALEYFAKGAYEQYKLPFTILRPFNCIGIGEKRALSDVEVKSGNISLALSHVVPDLIQKVAKGQFPLRILGKGNQIRHYTYGGDLARGIRLSLVNPNAMCNDFNLSTNVSTTVLELADLIWSKMRPDTKLQVVSDLPFEYDVQKRVPDCEKASKVLGFTATTTLDTALNEVIPWVVNQVKIGGI
jgi:UDP-glucose 4-epimerase